MRPLALICLILAMSGCSGGGAGGGQALVGVTVIDGLGNPPVPGRVVVIRDGRIAEVAAADGWQAPRGVQRIELPGRFVMPGLIDLHAHVTVLPLGAGGAAGTTVDRAASEQVLSTLLGFGITTVRNPAAPAADGVALRDAVAKGEVLGPRILTAGDALANLSRLSPSGGTPRLSPSGGTPHLSPSGGTPHLSPSGGTPHLSPSGGTAPSFGPFVATPDDDAVRREIERQADLGVDFIKVYASLAPEQVAAAVEAAHGRGVPVIGHLQRTTWTEAARLGVDAVTHGAPWSAAYLPAAGREGYRGTIRDRLDWLENVDFEGEEIREMIALLAEKQIPVDPTLIAYHTKFYGDDPMHRENPELHLAPALSRDAWERSTFVDDWTPEDFERARGLWPRVLELTRKLHEGGVPLTAGSDLPNPWVIPGVSLHHELRLLHSAGIPALEVLKIATSNGAAALGLEDEIGSIEPGKVADLIVLAADPTKNLHATRAISHLFVGGRFLDPAALLE